MLNAFREVTPGLACRVLPLALALVVRAGAEERRWSAGRSDSGGAAPELQDLRAGPAERCSSAAVSAEKEQCALTLEAKTDVYSAYVDSGGAAPELQDLRAGPAERCSSAAVPAEKEQCALTLEAKTDIYSAYVWRGKALDKHAVAQPSVIATLDAQEVGSFALKVWSNWDLSQKSADSKATKTGGGINVLNLTPSYTKAFGPVGLTVGNIFYTFPGDGYPNNSKSTYELYTTLAYKNPVATPSLSVYYDYRGVGGGFLEDNPAKDLYARAALDKSLRLSERVTACGTVLLGGGTSHYNAVRYRSSGEGFADYQASVNLSYALTDAFFIGTTLAYTGLIGGDLGVDRSALTPDEIFWGGVNLKWLF